MAIIAGGNSSRRDYRCIGSYGRHAHYNPAVPALAESRLSVLYRQLGLHCALALEESGLGYVRHLGDGRHVGWPEHVRAPNWGAPAAA